MRMERRTLQVPQPDRTMLRLCSAVQLGPLAIHVNGPSDSARRREARPHPLSMYGARASAQVAWDAFHLTIGKREMKQTCGTALSSPHVRYFLQIF